MLRRSNRLNASGYYDSDGKPLVSYKEWLNFYTRSRRFRRRCATSNIYSSSDTGIRHEESTTSQANRPNSQVNRIGPGRDLAVGPVSSNLTLLPSQVNKANSQDNRANSNRMGFPISRRLLWKLSLCLVLVSSIFGLYTYGIFLWPVPPITLIMPKTTGACDEIHKRLTQVTDELQRLKWKIDYRPPGDIMHNFALESQGARILEDMSSKTYLKSGACYILGLPICTVRVNSHNKSIVIEGKPIQTGRCWPFQGERGHLVIALSHPITISHVSMVHASKNMLLDGNITSAPKTFAVYGMKSIEDEGTLLGTFLYDRDKESLQTFELPDQDAGVFSIVKLQVMNNWGNRDYTCIYNFRVHGYSPPPEALERGFV